MSTRIEIEMTYARCPVCRGALVVADTRPGACRPCPCARGRTPGWAPTGLTLGQLDRLADVERALGGDPGLPRARRSEVLASLRHRLDLATFREALEAAREASVAPRPPGDPDDRR